MSGRRARSCGNRTACLGGLIFLSVIAYCVLVPIFSPFDPNDADFNDVRLLPSSEHWLGTDQYGRDIFFTRLAAGGRMTLLTAAGALLIILVIGAALRRDFRARRAGRQRDDADPGRAVRNPAVAGEHRHPRRHRAPGPERPDDHPRALDRQLDDHGAPRPRRGRAPQAAGLRPCSPGSRSGTPGGGQAAHRPEERDAGSSSYSLSRAAAVVLGEAFLAVLGLGPEKPTPTRGNMALEGTVTLFGRPGLFLLLSLAIAVFAVGANLLADGIGDALDPRRAGRGPARALDDEAPPPAGGSRDRLGQC